MINIIDFIKKYKIAIVIVIVFMIMIGGGLWHVVSHPIVAKWNDENGTITYNNETYYEVESVGATKFDTDQYLGQLDDGTSMYTVKYDSKGYICTSNNFLYSTVEQKLKETGRKATSIYVKNFKRITAEQDIATLLSLQAIQGETYTHKYLSADMYSDSLYVCYDDSAIATNWIGAVAHIDDNWVFVSLDNIIKGFSNKDRKETGIIITDNNIIDTLEKLFK
jgi:hypothetical protein